MRGSPFGNHAGTQDRETLEQNEFRFVLALISLAAMVVFVAAPSPLVGEGYSDVSTQKIG